MAIVGISDAQDDSLMWDIPLTPKLAYVNNILFYRQAANLSLDVEKVEWAFQQNGGTAVESSGIQVKQGEEGRGA